jgi:DNA-binding transcriptional ArsR family regulator
MALPKPAPALVNPRLAMAMSHPTRVHAMKVLFERTASPKEIAAEMDEPLNNVTYHVKQLLELGCIELVRIQPVHGGRVVEHFYRATRRAIFDSEAWEQFGEKEKMDVTASIMRLISGDITDAMSHGTFYEPDDNHLSRSPMVVDPEGWDEVNALLDQTLRQLFEIQERCVTRRQDAETEDMHIKVEIIHFSSPPPRKPRT